MRPAAITIAYNGTLKDASRLTLHRGTGGWAPGSVADQRMVRPRDGWETTVAASASTRQIDFAFTDGARWEDNNRADWHITLP